MLDGKVILITGGTGSLGRVLAKHLLEYHKPHKVIIFSRDEFKQSEMRKEIDDERLRYYIGDIRDPERLRWAFQGVDIIIHAAAMKQVPACEYNPTEATKTNVIGAMNIIDATRGLPIEKVICISSDKAVAPVNLYGASKMMAEKMFIDANSMRRIFSCTRWGNIETSRGSVIPLYKQLTKYGPRPLPLTHPDMTRFSLSFDEAIGLLLKAIEGPPGAIWVKRSPSMRMSDLVAAFGCIGQIAGIRSGEKLHETMVDRYECPRAFENEDNIIILPTRAFDTEIKYDIAGRLPLMEPYASDTNIFLTVEQIQERLAKYE